MTLWDMLEAMMDANAGIEIHDGEDLSENTQVYEYNKVPDQYMDREVEGFRFGDLLLSVFLR